MVEALIFSSILPILYILPFTATPADIHDFGHVNNAVWVRWIQDMATI
jgi:acyl-CoA thioester hydrolase